jgi:hypothetical protein
MQSSGAEDGISMDMGDQAWLHSFLEEVPSKLQEVLPYQPSS